MIDVIVREGGFYAGDSVRLNHEGFGINTRLSGLKVLADKLGINGAPISVDDITDTLVYLYNNSGKVKISSDFDFFPEGSYGGTLPYYSVADDERAFVFRVTDGSIAFTDVRVSALSDPLGYMFAIKVTVEELIQMLEWVVTHH